MQRRASTPLSIHRDDQRRSSTPLSMYSDDQQPGATPQFIDGDNQRRTSTPLFTRRDSQQGASSPLFIDGDNQRRASTPIFTRRDSQQRASTPLFTRRDSQQDASTPLSLYGDHQQRASTPLSLHMNTPQRAGTPIFRRIKSPFLGNRETTILNKQPVPPYHQLHDLQVGHYDESQAFDRFVSSLPRDFYSTKIVEGETSGSPHLLKFPLSVRFCIYSFLTESERAKNKKIILSPASTIAGFWPDDDFIEPSDVFYFIRDLSETCSQLRHEILSYYCSQFHFHITYNYFCTPFVAPIIHKWLPLFANRMQYLTVEADFTLLGGSYKNGAYPLPGGEKEIRAWMETLVVNLSDRDGSIQSLHIMCKRYKGYRPPSQDKMPGHSSPIKYCSTLSTHILDHLVSYLGLKYTPVLHFRLSGFPRLYSRDILRAVSGSDFGPQSAVTVPESPPWPREYPMVDMDSITIKPASSDGATPRAGSSLDMSRSDNNSPLFASFDSEIEPPPYGIDSDSDDQSAFSNGLGLGIQVPHQRDEYSPLEEASAAGMMDRTEAITDEIQQSPPIGSVFSTLFGGKTAVATDQELRELDMAETITDENQGTKTPDALYGTLFEGEVEGAIREELYQPEKAEAIIDETQEIETADATSSTLFGAETAADPIYGTLFEGGVAGVIDEKLYAHDTVETIANEAQEIEKVDSTLGRLFGQGEAGSIGQELHEPINTRTSGDSIQKVHTVRTINDALFEDGVLEEVDKELHETNTTGTITDASQRIGEKDPTYNTLF